MTDRPGDSRVPLAHFLCLSREHWELRVGGVGQVDRHRVCYPQAENEGECSVVAASSSEAFLRFPQFLIPMVSGVFCLHRLLKMTA